MTMRHRTLAFLGLTILLAGCGSSSDGGGGSTATAVIGSANAPVIAGAVMTAALDAGSAGDISGFGASPSALGQTDRNFAKVARIASAELKPLSTSEIPRAQEVPFGPEVTSCEQGGTVTTSGDLASPGTLSANDTITLVFDACAEADGIVDGRFAMSISSFSGNLLSGTFTIGLHVVLTNLSITAAGETATLDGDLSLMLATTASGVTTTISSTSLTVAELGGAAHTLSGYTLTETLTLATGAFTLDVSGMLTSTAFTGSVTFDTLVPFSGMGTEYPSAGEMLITGANGGTISIVVLDSTFVRLGVDANGDGMVDEYIDRAWSEIL